MLTIAHLLYVGMNGVTSMFIKHFEVKAAAEIKTWCIESCLENK